VIAEALDKRGLEPEVIVNNAGVIDRPSGTRQTVLCPGAVPSALQARAGMTGVLPRLFMRSAEEVAREAYRGLSQGRRMVVPGFANRAVTTVIRLSPRSLWLELIARQQVRGADGTQEA
jgi:short-subunit dehydrogenase